MSDFEDVFGAGADASMVIDGLSRQSMRGVGRGYQPPKPDPKKPTVIMGYEVTLAFCSYRCAMEFLKVTLVKGSVKTHNFYGEKLTLLNIVIPSDEAGARMTEALKLFDWVIHRDTDNEGYPVRMGALRRCA